MFAKMASSVAVITGRTLLKTKKYSPEILVGIGVIGVVSAAVMVGKATASDRYADAMADFNEGMEKINDARSKIKPTDTKKLHGQDVLVYSEEDEVADRAWQVKKFATAMIKLYGPAATTMVISVACILWGFRIVKGRNVALIAAYKILDKGFKDYRGRVRNELGKDMDTHFMYDTDIKTETKTVTAEDGTNKKEKVTTQILKGTPVSGYARIFDQNSSIQWSRNPDYNWVVLKKKLDYLNDRLNAVGHVFLNEVYDELGFEHTSEGAVVGWVKGNGDGYISFGPWWESCTDEPQARFDNTILLDFNVDGIIWDMI